MCHVKFHITKSVSYATRQRHAVSLKMLLSYLESCEITPKLHRDEYALNRIVYRNSCTALVVQGLRSCLFFLHLKTNHCGSKRPYTSEKKDNRPWTVMRAATNWATHTTAFLTRRLPVVSRTGRTEYQLLLTKASKRSKRQVLGNILVVFWWI